MNADIFISYSSKDREKAEQLTELLSSAGLSVWIDKSGIDVATSWSGEIVDAIEGCKAFVVLLSPNSILSENVIKEVSLAAEQKKKILPLDLEPVELPRDLKYHLAGIQRAPMTNIDSIIRAIGKLGLEATQAPALKLVKETDGRKSLMILPFEDLSPTADNQWFADGLVGELIDALGHIKSLRILDSKTSLALRGVKKTTVEIGQLFNTRYFIEGSVRKFGDQIKISVSLLDIETGDHLWQESHRGEFKDIFDIQESVAAKVVDALKLHLSTKERSLLEERGTSNVHAYELFMRAREYLLRSTQVGLEHAVSLLSEAIRIDEKFVDAYLQKAQSLCSLYRSYVRDPVLLEDARQLCAEVEKIRPDYHLINHQLMLIAMFRGRHEEAEAIAIHWRSVEPNSVGANFALGALYIETGKDALAIEPFEEALRLQPDNMSALWNMVICCNQAGEKEKCKHWSLIALPYFNRFLKLYPDDEARQVYRAVLFHFIGEDDKALATVAGLQNLRDGFVLYNASCLLWQLNQPQEALATFRKALEAGFKNITLIRSYMIEHKDLAGTTEYDEIKKMVKQIVKELSNAPKGNG